MMDFKTAINHIRHAVYGAEVREAIAVMGEYLEGYYRDCAEKMETAIAYAKQAIASAAEAKASASEAKVSADKASDSQKKAATSEANALKYQNESQKQAEIATAQASTAKNSADQATEDAASAKSNAEKAAVSEANALKYQNKAQTSAETASNQAAEAKKCADGAATSASTAQAAKENAQTSATKAANSEANALTYQNGAKTSAETAQQQAALAKASADSAALVNASVTEVYEYLTQSNGNYYSAYVLTIPVASWKTNNEYAGYSYCAEIACVGAKEYRIPVGSFKLTEQEEIEEAGFAPSCESKNDILRFFAKKIPKKEVEVRVLIFGTTQSDSIASDEEMSEMLDEVYKK